MYIYKKIINITTMGILKKIVYVCKLTLFFFCFSKQKNAKTDFGIFVKIKSPELWEKYLQNLKNGLKQNEFCNKNIWISANRNAIKHFK